MGVLALSPRTIYLRACEDHKRILPTVINFCIQKEILDECSDCYCTRREARITAETLKVQPQTIQGLPSLRVYHCMKGCRCLFCEEYAFGLKTRATTINGFSNFIHVRERLEPSPFVNLIEP